MKESVLDALMFLLDNYSEDGAMDNDDRDELAGQLANMGFGEGEIDHAFDWLESLAQDETDTADTDCKSWSKQAQRHFSPQELYRLTVEARGFLIVLSQNPMIDAPSLDRIIDRAMALDLDEIDLEAIKWITQMVIYNRPDAAHLYAYMEELALPEPLRRLH
jgi:Smg protein